MLISYIISYWLEFSGFMFAFFSWYFFQLSKFFQIVFRYWQYIKFLWNRRSEMERQTIFYSWFIFEYLKFPWYINFWFWNFPWVFSFVILGTFRKKVIQCQFKCRFSKQFISKVKEKKFKFCSKIMIIHYGRPLQVYLCALIMTFQNISFNETIGNKATINFGFRGI